MNDRSEAEAQAAELRRRAEADLARKGAQAPGDPGALAPEDPLRLLHELQVHRIELDLQNEELRRAQVELESSRARYFELYDLAPVGYCTLGANGLIQEANLTAALLLGVPRAALARQPLTRFILGPDQDLYYLRRQGFLKAGQPFECELRMARPNGGYFWAHLAAVGAPEPEAGRDQAELRLVLSDVTERVVEVDRRQRELEEQVRQRTAALVEANRQKDEFLATMAHELRNPLTPIRTGAYLLGLRAGQDPETRQILDLITRQAAHMARMVDDLLDVSRIERGKVDLRKQAVDLGQAVAQAIETCRPVAEAGQLRLTLAQPAPLPILEADPVRLEQMLGNLLNNACKFTPAGGAIEVTAVQEGGEAVLRIRDSGTGMTADQVAHSFDLFYQGGSAMDQPRQGLGIGLTLVRQLAQLHGGSVAARSDGPGKGSEFILRLPVQPVPVRLLPAGRADGGNPAGRSRRVLVVDDDDNVRATSVKLLEAQGYQVLMADTGEKGVELALALRPEIAIIDLGMPGLNGLEVAGRIRAALGSAIRLVAFTGFSREADVARARAAGFDLHLAKSGDPQELLDLLRDMPQPPGAFGTNGAGRGI